MKLTKKNIFVLLSICFLIFGVAFLFQHGFNAISSRDLATDSGFDSDFGGGSSGGGGSSSSSDYGGSSSDYYDRNGSGSSPDIPGEIIIISFVIALIASIIIFVSKIVSRSKNNGKVNYCKEVVSSCVDVFLIFIAIIIIYEILVMIYTVIIAAIGDPIIVLGIFSPFVLLMVIMYIYVKKLKQNEMAKRDAYFFVETLHNPSIVKEAYEIYVKIQEAWSKNDIEDVRSLLSPEMYNMYSSQIKTMIRKKQRNAMSDFKFVKGAIHEYQNIDGQDRYTVILQVLCKDYMINDETNKVIRGSSKKTNDYIYSLTFVKDKEVDIDKCPNCQGDLSNSGQSVKCPYCGAVIERKATNLVLVEKKMLRQR